MKKSISICIFIVVLAWLIAMLILLFRDGEQKEERLTAAETEQKQAVLLSEKTEDPSVESMAAPQGAAYLARDKEGRLVVYREDGTTVYLETNIRCQELEHWLQEQLQEGIWFETDKELFDFLENYSS